MKKRILFLFVLLCVVFATVFAACSSPVGFKLNFVVEGQTVKTIDTNGQEVISLPENPQKEGYVFDGWYWDNNVWSRPFTANSLLDTPLSSDMSVYAHFVENTKCGISFNTLSVDGDSVFGKVPNSQSVFSFINEVKISGNATFVVSTDIYGMQQIPTKTVPLEIGDNTFYITETVGNDIKLFTVTIRRKPIYTVSFNTNGGNYVASQQVEEDYFAVKPTTSRLGYDFVSWNYDFSKPITKSQTITANWKIITYNIAYVLESGATLITTKNTYTVEDAFAFDTPSKDYYDFVEWRENGAKVTGINRGTTGNKTLTAFFTPTVYSIIYNLDGGTNNLNNRSRYTIEDETIELLAPTKFGYTFKGFYKNQEFSEPITEIKSGSHGNVKVYAKWTYNTVTTNTNLSEAGTYTTYTNNKITAGEEVTLTATTNKGYIFLGWYDGENLLTEETTYTFAMPEENLTYTAKWKTITYDIIYVLEEGATLTTTKNTYTVEDAFAFDTPSKDYYDFIEWRENGLKVTGISKGATGNKTLTAVFTPTVYLITYDMGVGTNNASNPKNYTFESETITLIDPEPVKGYNFKGYYSDSSFTTPITKIEKGSHGNVNVYAKWELWEGLENLIFTFTNDTNCKITGVKDKTVKKIVVSDCVTEIASGAFSGCSSLEEITLPFVGGSKSATSSSSSTLFGYIFGTSSYTGGASTEQYYSSSSYVTYYIPTSLKKVTVTGGRISYHAFNNCSSLESVTIGNSVTSIGYRAFYNCSSLTSITIPNSVTSIGELAFYNCSSLKSITIPNSVTSIGNYAFYNCSSLKSITIPDGVTSIGNDAFYNCSSLQYNEYENGLYLGNDENPYLVLVKAKSTGITSCKINDNCRIIYYNAFKNCSSLTIVTIGNSVTSIGSSAFSGCSSLEEITIPFVGGSKNATSASSSTLFGYIFGTSSYTGGTRTEQYCSSSSYSYVTYYIPTSLKKVTITGGNILYGAFYNCSSLTSITIPDSVTSIGDHAFYNCSSLESITIPNSVTSIGDHAFYNCSSLESITIGDSVTSIGNYAFYNCSSFTSIMIPNSVTSVGDYVFYGCSLLTSIIIPDKVTCIGSGAFEDCSSLTSITIGNSVTSIGDYAFEDCSKLTKVNYLGTIDQWVQISFGNSYANPLYYAKDLYINDKLVTEATIITATKINAYAFCNCRSLTSITIPNSVTSIGASAFSGCSSLTSITIPDSVTSIGASAFSSCRSLTSITIPDSVTSIGDYAFSGCSSLMSITMGNSVTSIGFQAFYGCYRLVEVINNSSLNVTKGASSNGYVGYYALNVKNGGTSDIVNKDGYLFYTYGGKNNLLGYAGTATELTLPEDYNGQSYEIYKYAFCYCSSLTSITIPNSVPSIGDYAFWYCSSLTSITIGDSVKCIGDRAFRECSSLTSITIPNSVTSIGKHAFGGCILLTSITFNDTSTWYITDNYTNWENKSGGTQTSATYPSNNAIQLIATYCDYYWYKK